MIVDAYAVTSAKGQRRKDFSLDEISEGSVFYYQQTDNLSGKAMYRMQIIAASPDRLVFEVENISTCVICSCHFSALAISSPFIFSIENRTGRTMSGGITASCERAGKPAS